MMDPMKLRTLATEIDTLRAMESWLSNYGESEYGMDDTVVKVEWSYASSCHGYRETKAAVSNLVQVKLKDLIREAISIQRVRVKDAADAAELSTP